MSKYDNSQNLHCTTNNPPSHEQLKKALSCRSNQKEIILNHLKTYGRISTIEAYQMFILSPAARILELREDGHNIVTQKDHDKNGMATYILPNTGGNDHE